MARPKKNDQPTVNVSLRIDPKVKFAIELLAREQKRTITGVVEWSVMQALNGQRMKTPAGNDVSFLELMDLVWSPDEAERITLLGVFAPHILDHEESCIWNVIKSSGIFLEATEIDPNGMAKAYRPKMGFIKLVWPMIKDRGIALAQWPTPYQSTVITEAEIRAELGDEVFLESESFR
ncbi:hypothetical protein D0A22_02435 [Stutzerimonas stutzeri]|nr:hypothetical protein D0A22_02435 [Stutzerimonas stutzeri]